MGLISGHNDQNQRGPPAEASRRLTYFRKMQTVLKKVEVRLTTRQTILLVIGLNGDFA